MAYNSVQPASFIQTVVRIRISGTLLRVEQVQGSESYPLRVFVKANVKRGEDISVAMANAVGARKLLVEWGSSHTEDVWAQILAALKLEQEGTAGKKRKL